MLASEKTADISRPQHCTGLSAKHVTSEKRLQKFHTRDVSLP